MDLYMQILMYHGASRTRLLEICREGFDMPATLGGQIRVFNSR